MPKTTGGLGFNNIAVTNEIAADLATMDAAIEMFDRELDIDLDMTVITSDTDSGLPIDIEYKRKDGTKQKKAVLTNKNASGKYGTLTVTYYAVNGTTVLNTRVWTLTYSEAGVLTSRVGVRA